MTRLHRGKLFYVAAPLEATLAGLCRKSAEEAADGASGSDAARLTGLLSEGPLPLEQIQAGQVALEGGGAIFTEEVRLEAHNGGLRATGCG